MKIVLSLKHKVGKQEILKRKKLKFLKLVKNNQKRRKNSSIGP